MQIFPWMLKTVKVVVRGTVYTNCVYTVPITDVDSDLPLNVKES